jgi:hypothetical protein
MWCANCQAEVAAEVSADNRRIHCASCSGELSSGQPNVPETKTRHALELLERWSRSPLLDPFGPVPGTPDSIADNVPLDRPVRSAKAPRPKSKPVFRIDSSHVESETGTDMDADVGPELETLAPASSETQTAETPRPEMAAVETPAADTGLETHRIDQAHQASVPAPHFDVQAAIQQSEQRKGNWLGLAGQLLAYLGVALLTVGTAMVLWGYFGGPKNYAPTGWLITTAGQMLLFLGVITLVSGGMEQTTEEVRTQIEGLGQQILRIEQSSRHQRMGGPHFSVRQLADSETEQESDKSHQPVG